eukprot:TRINITY_DN2970_c0_g1_i4.p1 TRINITY_DN2970_c0_g1~~TRINITY_DN2970_c0_g1_i4.p1  ORF type:complete len:483 (+),score=84.21 TRINITY_DN2970_c0_g1_i4:53-1501(+)
MSPKERHPNAPLYFLALVLTLAGIQEIVCRENFYDQIYQSFDGRPCVRLLDDRRGSVGCSTTMDGLRGELVYANIPVSINQLFQNPPSEDSIVFMEGSLFSDETIDKLLKADWVKGILVGAGSRPSKYSVADKIPLLEWSLHPELNTNVWNDVGNGAMYRRYKKPLYSLSENETEIFRQKAKENSDNGGYPRWAAELTSFMHATKDSTTCLRREHCQPIGGRNVWGTPSRSIQQQKEIVMATATVDSNAFFQDEILGASAYLSGVVALLGAIEGLSRENITQDSPRQLVVSLFQGEVWDYIGSMSFIKRAKDSASGDAASQLGLDRIAYMVDISQVGLPSGGPSYFIHYDRKTQGNNPKTADLIKAFESTASPKVSKSADTLQTFPPSPLHTFMRERGNIAGIVIADHNEKFGNLHYLSQWDDGTGIKVEDELCKLSASIQKGLVAMINNTDLKTVVLKTPANCSLVVMNFNFFMSFIFLLT